jgi:hypothetical protein
MKVRQVAILTAYLLRILLPVIAHEMTATRTEFAYASEQRRADLLILAHP